MMAGSSGPDVSKVDQSKEDMGSNPANIDPQYFYICDITAQFFNLVFVKSSAYLHVRI